MSFNGAIEVRYIDAAERRYEIRLRRVVEISERLVSLRDDIAWNGHPPCMVRERDWLYALLEAELAELRKAKP